MKRSLGQNCEGWGHGGIPRRPNNSRVTPKVCTRDQNGRSSTKDGTPCTAIEIL